jgi:uncharacterized protein
MDTRTDSKTRLFLRILRFPLTRLLLLPYILFYVTFSGKLFMQTFAPDPLLSLVVGVLAVANLLLVYVSFGYFVERRPVSELTLPGMGRELGIGLLLGFGLFTACVLIAMALGLYRIEGIDSWQNLMPTGGALVTPVGEEMLFRGVVFRIFEDLFGGWIALVLSSLIAILVSATASVLMLILAVRRGKIVPPIWKRRA